jgi:hypothetical protein
MNIFERLRATVDFMIESGIPTDKVPEEVREERFKICQSCPSEKLVKISNTCLECGCFMRIKTSLEFDPVKSAKEGKLIKTACPLKHWEEYHSPN